MTVSKYSNKSVNFPKKSIVLGAYLLLVTHSYSSLALSYYLEALPVYAPENPDSLDTSTFLCSLSNDSASNREGLTRYVSIWNTVYQKTAHSTIRYMVRQSHNSSRIDAEKYTSKREICQNKRWKRWNIYFMGMGSTMRFGLCPGDVAKRLESKGISSLSSTNSCLWVKINKLRIFLKRQLISVRN